MSRKRKVDKTTESISRAVASKSGGKHLKPGRWVLPGECVKIHGFTIMGGFFYFGNTLLAEKWRLRMSNINEASLVNDQLEITKAAIGHDDYSLDGSLRYDVLSRKCRGAYLKWLAGKRDKRNVPSEYILLYIAGIERRIFIDAGDGIKVSNREFKLIYRELQRLHSIYSGWEYNDVHEVLLKLFITMRMLRPRLKYGQATEETSTISNDMEFQLQLARLLAVGKPIPGDLACDVVFKFDEFHPRGAAVRCPNEFKLLFIRLYQEDYGKGVIVKPGGDNITLGYMPINDSMEIQNIIDDNLPAPAYAQWPFSSWLELARIATNMLGPYSRQLNRLGPSEDVDLRAVLFLPEQLGDLRHTHDMDEFQKWVQDRIDNHDGWADANEFWHFVNPSPPKTIQKTDLELMQKLVDIADISLIPDPRYHRDKPTADGIVKFLPKAPDFNLTDDFTFMLVHLRLGAAVIAVSDESAEAMVAHLNDAINGCMDLSLAACGALDHYLSWRIKMPAKSEPTKSWMNQLNQAERQKMRRALLQLALVSSSINPKVMRLLEKFYIAMGFETASVARDLHDIAVGQLNLTAQDEEVSGKLNKEKIVRHEQQTREAQALLGNIFQEGVADAKTLAAESSADNLPQNLADENPQDLEARHKQLYDRLVDRDSWRPDELGNLCRELGLMAAAAMEAINDWSYHHVEAPVLLDEGNIIVDYDIVEELKG